MGGTSQGAQASPRGALPASLLPEPYYEHKTRPGLGTKPGIQGARDGSGQSPQELSLVLLNQ